jgi:ElaB/YqjD/DUF883 family membrane-anchored ribosome-binding protein
MGQVPDERNEMKAVVAEVDTLRERTQQIVSELERRLRARATKAKHTLARARHAVDVKAQLREHPQLTVGVSTVAAIGLGVGIYVIVARRLEARRPQNRLRARVRAYRAFLAQPQRALRKKEPIGRRLLAAAIIAGTTTIVRSVTLMLLKREVEPRVLPPRRVEFEQLPAI